MVKIWSKFENLAEIWENFIAFIHIFEHLSLHIHVRASKPSYTLIWEGSSKTTVAQKCSGAMEIQKYDQPTNGRTNRRTDQRTDGLTWVGARDTCLSKNILEHKWRVNTTCLLTAPACSTARSKIIISCIVNLTAFSKKSHLVESASLPCVKTCPRLWQTVLFAETVEPWRPNAAVSLTDQW